MEKKTNDYKHTKIYELIVLGELILSLSTILRLVFGTIPTVWYFLFFIKVIYMYMLVICYFSMSVEGHV